LITRKKKTCKQCKDEKYIFSSGLCLQCWKTIKGTKIPPVSSRNKERQVEYLRLREEYLRTHPKCEVCNLQDATEIHHKRGRIGENLFNDFLAVDRDCHRQIEENPQWAKEQNFSLSRL